MMKTTSTRSFPSLATVIGSEVVLGLEQTNLSESQDFFAGVRRYGIPEQKAFSFVLNMKEDTRWASKLLEPTLGEAGHIWI